MKKLWKRIVATAMAVMMVVTCMSVDVVKAAEDVTEYTAEEQELMEAITDDVLYIYSWNDEFAGRLSSFYEKYPQYEKLVKYVNMGVGGTSKEYTDEISRLIKANGKKVPSLVCYDESIAQAELSSSNFVPLKKIGYKDKFYKNAFNYTKQIGSVNGKLKGVAWQAAPGCFIYNRRIAKEVFGTDDPAKIQKQVKDWDAFYKAAKKLKKKGYKIACSEYEITRPMLSNPTAKASKNGKIKITADIKECVNYTKKLYDNKMIGRAQQWSEEWAAEMQSETSTTFGYFGCTWFLRWSLYDTSATAGYNICMGPEAFTWGGTYVGATKNCTNPGLAALILKHITNDTDAIYQYATENMDYPNNMVVAKQLASAGLKDCSQIKKQNHYKVWFQTAKKVNAKNCVPYQYYYDASLAMAISDNATDKYDPFTYENVIKSYKQYVQNNLDYFNE